MKFELKFNCDNASFSGGAHIEIARILREIADKIEQLPTNKGKAVDRCGNIVGEWEISGY